MTTSCIQILKCTKLKNMNKIKCKFYHHWWWRLHNFLLNKMYLKKKNCGQFRTVLVMQTVWVNDSNQWACSRHNPSWSSRWIPQHPSSSCLYCCAACFKRLQRWVRYRCTERPQRGSTVQVCWCRTKYTTEQRSRERPSMKLRPTQESAVIFLVVSWAVVSDGVCSSQSPELSCELSSPAAFQFFLLFFFEFGPESESLWESCFRLLRLWVRLSLSYSSLLSPELLSSSLPLVLAVFLFLCRPLVLFLLCLSLVSLLSSLLLVDSALLRFSPSSFFFFFFFFFLEDFLDLGFFTLWRPTFFASLLFSLRTKTNCKK